MPKLPKFLIGLTAALAAGWLSHGPLGRGDAFAGQVDAAMQAVIAETNVRGITARLQRDPLSRTATLSGPADCFQRQGLGSLPGIDGRVLSVAGVARVEWTNPPPEGECR